MSMSAQYHAIQWSLDKTAEQIAARVAELEALPSHRGIEFDDTRVNHMRQTEIDTLRGLIDEPRLIRCATSGRLCCVGCGYSEACKHVERAQFRALMEGR